MASASACRWFCAAYCLGLRETALEMNASANGIKPEFPLKPTAVSQSREEGCKDPDAMDEDVAAVATAQAKACMTEKQA